MKNIIIACLLSSVFISISQAQSKNKYQLTSPNGMITVVVETSEGIHWSAQWKGADVVNSSAIAMHLQNGEVLGSNIKVQAAKTEKVNTSFAALNYKKDSIINSYNQLTINCKGSYGIIFRVYNDGVAYRFFTNRKDSLVINSENAEFNFAGDPDAYVAYSNDPHENDKYQTSFENLYQHIKLSGFIKDTVAFAPVLIAWGDGKKAVVTEADLEEYPGMFLQGHNNSLYGNFAHFVLAEKSNPGNDAQSLVAKRADYIAVTAGSRNFPWRILVISGEDKELLDNDMVYKLASPSRITDISWIKPGKASWDWWNNWNISHVNFKAGINTETYKFYIDFAAANHTEYILMDAGWSDGKDLMKIIPEINLPEIIRYAAQKNIGVWLWGGSRPMKNKMDEVLDAYSKMGIKGFKIDFMDRDDQGIVEFYYELARKAAAHHLMIDFHGAYKPTGLQRTYPNVLGFEGVRGLENDKWSSLDMPPYDATIPFIRMLAGPMDYTPGAMKNASKADFHPLHNAPMSQGTRCHQLAMYIVYEAPFGMLADNPNNYMKEQESTNFITGIPTVFNQTVALDSKVGEYASIARRKGNNWYIGIVGDWKEHDLTIDFSFLGNGNYEAEIFKDGINANREATDYSREIIKLSKADKLNIHIANGGGWAARITKLN